MTQHATPGVRIQPTPGCRTRQSIGITGHEYRCDTWAMLGAAQLAIGNPRMPRSTVVLQNVRRRAALDRMDVSCLGPGHVPDEKQTALFWGNPRQLPRNVGRRSQLNIRTPSHNEFHSEVLQLRVFGERQEA